jgi:hypothetical protein
MSSYKKKINTVRAGRLLKRVFGENISSQKIKVKNFRGNVKEYKSSG